MKRLTLHYGGRFEHFNASIPAESSPASTWIGARNFPEVTDVPNWNDWALRLAAACDVTGDGKTALKGNAGKLRRRAGGWLRADVQRHERHSHRRAADAQLERRQR